MAELLYIDEDRAQGDWVIRAAVRSRWFSREQVRTLVPSSTLEEMVEVIVNENCRVLVTDWDLSDEQLGVQFNGTDLVTELSRRFEGFPCFVTTNYPKKAVGLGVDATLIFPKDDYLDPDKAHTTRLTFFNRVRQSMDDYDRRYAEKSARFEHLHSQAKERPLEVAETEELLELDGFFERALNKTGAVPKIVKEQALKPFSDLLAATSSLIEKIEGELKDSEGAQ